MDRRTSGSRGPGDYPRDANETNPRTTGGDRDLARTYMFDGMNWEADQESPVISVSLQAMRQALTGLR
jgi:hypothetical protein